MDTEGPFRITQKSMAAAGKLIASFDRDFDVLKTNRKFPSMGIRPSMVANTCATC